MGNMSLTQLYQKEIKQHSQRLVNNKTNFTSTHQVDGYNPSCGDELTLYLQVAQNGSYQKVNAISVEADACIICKASASLLCEHSEGKTVIQLQEDIGKLIQAIKNKSELTIKQLQCLTVVCAHPSRMNCALLPWTTLSEAFKQSSVTVPGTE